MAIASNNNRLLRALQRKLQANFDVSLFGQLRSFIGWDITRTPTGIKIDQSTYIRSLINKYGMSKANSVRTPLASNADLGPATADEAVLDADGHYMFRAVIGGLLYLAVSTRPELSKPVGSLAQQMHAQAPRHLAHSKRVLRYPIGSVHVGIHYSSNGPWTPSCFVAAVDADWGGDKDTRRSTTGYVVTVNGSPIYWKSNGKPSLPFPPQNPSMLRYRLVRKTYRGCANYTGKSAIRRPGQITRASHRRGFSSTAQQLSQSRRAGRHPRGRST